MLSLRKFCGKYELHPNYCQSRENDQAAKERKSKADLRLKMIISTIRKFDAGMIKPHSLLLYIKRKIKNVHIVMFYNV